MSRDSSLLAVTNTIFVPCDVTTLVRSICNPVEIILSHKGTRCNVRDFKSYLMHHLCLYLVDCEQYAIVVMCNSFFFFSGINFVTLYSRNCVAMFHFWSKHPVAGCHICACSCTIALNLTRSTGGGRSCSPVGCGAVQRGTRKLDRGWVRLFR